MSSCVLSDHRPHAVRRVLHRMSKPEPGPHSRRGVTAWADVRIPPGIPEKPPMPFSGGPRFKRGSAAFLRAPFPSQGALQCLQSMPPGHRPGLAEPPRVHTCGGRRRTRTANPLLVRQVLSPIELSAHLWLSSLSYRQGAELHAALCASCGGRPGANVRRVCHGPRKHAAPHCRLDRLPRRSGHRLPRRISSRTSAL